MGEKGIEGYMDKLRYRLEERCVRNKSHQYWADWIFITDVDQCNSTLLYIRSFCTETAIVENSRLFKVSNWKYLIAILCSRSYSHYPFNVINVSHSGAIPRINQLLTQTRSAIFAVHDEKCLILRKNLPYGDQFLLQINWERLGFGVPIPCTIYCLADSCSQHVVFFILLEWSFSPVMMLQIWSLYSPNCSFQTTEVFWKT